MADIELYGTAGCPYTAAAREHLEWERRPFAEFDVEADAGAFRRMVALTGGQRTVPVLVIHGRVQAIGWQGRGCLVAPPHDDAPRTARAERAT